MLFRLVPGSSTEASHVVGCLEAVNYEGRLR